MINKLVERLRGEPLLLAAALLAAVSSLAVRPRWSAIDWDVLMALFNLMVVVRALDRLSVFDWLAVSLLKRVSRERAIGLTLTAVTFFASMLITNDVALITLVPLAIIVARRAGFNPAYLIILLTLAANVGSSLTPLGNPQNLFLYAYYEIPLGPFVRAIWPVVAAGAVWLVLLHWRIPQRQVTVPLDDVPLGDRRRIGLWLALFALVVASILRWLPHWAALIAVLLASWLLDRRALAQADHALLGTFIALFVFVDNVARVPQIAAAMGGLLGREHGPYLAGVLLSQVISNVPAAILLAGFTDAWPGLLRGVSVGGVGTLIASMASVISYRLYAKAYPGQPYLGRFHLVNACTLLVLGLAGLLLA